MPLRVNTLNGPQKEPSLDKPHLYRQWGRAGCSQMWVLVRVVGAVRVGGGCEMWVRPDVRAGGGGKGGGVWAGIAWKPLNTL